MASSIASNASSQSVSVFGQEMELEQAIDQVFREIQQFVNYIQSDIRSLSVVPEQDNDYMRALEIYTEIEDHISGLNRLFAESLSVSRQVLGPVPKALKAEVKKYKDDLKVKRQKAKEDAKAEAKKLKEEEKAGKETEK